MTSFRSQLFSSLVALPMANALGHLAPAIGASWAAVGMKIWDFSVLLLLFSVHALLDSYDKYKDMPKIMRPSGLPWLMWVCPLTLVIASSSYQCGYRSTIRIVWFLGLEILWAGPLVPFYTPKQGFSLVKLKQIFGPLKSVFCGIMAGLMDSASASLHACILHPEHCTSATQHTRALAYSILYSFIRETVYDARDIEEDNREGIKTLATVLGMRGTIAVLIISSIGGEATIAEDLDLTSVIRAIASVTLSNWVASHPRESRWPWVAFSLFSLVPAWHAQASLRVHRKWNHS